ncbi:MAG: peptidyl-prolyl cis-trans isomerase [Melioribacteraceae bacterium]|nr:peptidyl-prolyl cis-trans isomerase [Melioribacteraceae bacterium]
MKYKISLFLFLLAVLSTFSFAQKQNLAKIGSIELSAKEFKQRFELTPKIEADFDSTKINFLYSLIAEKLWALEAQSLSMDAIPYIYNSIKNTERKLVEDKLYKIEIESKVKITEKEISENLFKIDENRSMNFLFSKDQYEIDRLYVRLLLGESIDSLLVGRGEQSQQTEGVPVVFGQMDEQLEDIIYSLELNKFTEPIPVKVGWVIYYLKSIEVSSIENGNNEKEKRKKVDEILFARKAKVFYKEFFNNYILGNTVHANKPLLNYLVDEIFNFFRENGEGLYNENTKKYQLNEYQIKTIKSKFSEGVLSSNIIEFKISPVSLRKYFISLELNGFGCKKRSKGAIYEALNENIKIYIFEELLFREGYTRGLQNSKEIQDNLKMWRESFLSTYYQQSFLDSVKTGDGDAKEFSNKAVPENGNSITETSNEVTEKIKSGLYFKELENLYIDETVALAKKYGVSVDANLFNLIQKKDIEIRSDRPIGFSRKIAEVPYLNSFYKWKNWLPKTVKESLP